MNCSDSILVKIKCELIFLYHKPFAVFNKSSIPLLDQYMKLYHRLFIILVDFRASTNPDLTLFIAKQIENPTKK